MKYSQSDKHFEAPHVFGTFHSRKRANAVLQEEIMKDPDSGFIYRDISKRCLEEHGVYTWWGITYAVVKIHVPK